MANSRYIFSEVHFEIDDKRDHQSNEKGLVLNFHKLEKTYKLVSASDYLTTESWTEAQIQQFMDTATQGLEEAYKMFIKYAKTHAIRMNINSRSYEYDVTYMNGSKSEVHNNFWAVKSWGSRKNVTLRHHWNGDRQSTAHGTEGSNQDETLLGKEFKAHWNHVTREFLERLEARLRWVTTEKVVVSA